MMRIGILDLGSFFWTLAGARSKDEGAAGLALQVLRYMRERSEKGGLDAVMMASDGPPEVPSRSWRLRVDPDYKGHRAPKDEAQRAELVALVGALESAGFPVVAAVDEHLRGATPDLDYWFEADDVAYSAAKKVASSSTDVLKFEAHVFSNDWDLAQVLKDNYRECATCAAKPGSPELCADCLRRRKIPNVRLFTTRGVERTAADVEREFGCSAAKLAELKALAGDVSDGYKPFPGEAPGKPGIGEKGAADLLKAFGSAHSAVAAALSDLDSAFAEKGIPKRIPALLRKGGEDALERGLRLATLRGDASVPDNFEVGDWEDAEAILLARQVEQSAPAFDRALAEAEPISPIGCAGATPEEADAEGRRIAEELDRASLTSRTAQKIVAGIEAVGGAAREVSGSIETLGLIVDKWRAEDGALPPAGKAEQERAAQVVDRELAPKTERVLLIEAEFWAVAPLPTMWATGVLDVPEDIAPEVDAFVQALAAGALRPTVDRRAFIGDLSKEAAAGLRLLSELAVNAKNGVGTAEAWSGFAEQLKWLPRFATLADYGRPLVRLK